MSKLTNIEFGIRVLNVNPGLGVSLQPMKVYHNDGEVEVLDCLVLVVTVERVDTDLLVCLLIHE